MGVSDTVDPFVHGDDLPCIEILGEVRAIACVQTIAKAAGEYGEYSRTNEKKYGLREKVCTCQLGEPCTDSGDGKHQQIKGP